MKRYLGLDLGTTTCGVAMTDRANIMVHPYKTIRFNREDYVSCYNEIVKIINSEHITDIAIGLPVNMDGSKGFASDRTENFIKLFDGLDVNIVKIDERLTSMESHRILHDCNIKEKNFRDKVDMQSAVLILESYLRSIK